MSFFDPYHIFQHKQRASKKGQILRKKPINQSRAYSGKDLEQAYRVLKAYGIPYGNQPEPVPPSPPTPDPPQPPPYPLFHSVFNQQNILLAIQNDWDDTIDQPNTTLTDGMIMLKYFDTVDGAVISRLDPSKVTNYECVISGKNITYYYDPALPFSGTTYDYSIEVNTSDRMSNYTVNLHLLDSEGPGPDVPNRYIEKTMVNYWSDESPRLVQQNDNYDGTSYVTSRSVVTKNFSNAYQVEYNSDDLSFSDLINLDYEPTIIGRTWPTSVVVDTTGVVSTIATVSFYIEYTD